jgi:hypothetical protein
MLMISFMQVRSGFCAPVSSHQLVPAARAVFMRCVVHVSASKRQPPPRGAGAAASMNGA